MHALLSLYGEIKVLISEITTKSDWKRAANCI